MSIYEEKLGKLDFRIIHCSSEEKEHPSNNLLTSNPKLGGWTSSRFCNYPQELTFQFKKPVIVRQLQLLSHESKISQKIEIFTCLPN
jgi:centrosomal protein CEP104